MCLQQELARLRDRPPFEVHVHEPVGEVLLGLPSAQGIEIEQDQGAVVGLEPLPGVLVPVHEAARARRGHPGEETGRLDVEVGVQTEEQGRVDTRGAGLEGTARELVEARKGSPDPGRCEERVRRQVPTLDPLLEEDARLEIGPLEPRRPQPLGVRQQRASIRDPGRLLGLEHAHAEGALGTLSVRALQAEVGPQDGAALGLVAQGLEARAPPSHVVRREEVEVLDPADGPAVVESALKTSEDAVAREGHELRPVLQQHGRPQPVLHGGAPRPLREAGLVAPSLPGEVLLPGHPPLVAIRPAHAVAGGHRDAQLPARVDLFEGHRRLGTLLQQALSHQLQHDRVRGRDEFTVPHPRGQVPVAVTLTEAGHEAWAAAPSTPKASR